MKRKIIGMMMAMAMVFGLSVNVYAEEPDVVEPVDMAQEQAVAEPVELMQGLDVAESIELVPEEESVTAACTHPQWTWACRKNYIGTKNNVTHKYGFLFGETCMTTVKLSTVRNYCYICKANLPQYDTAQQHECRQIHQNCGKGTVDICTIIGQYSIKEEIR